jgi:hypothetical protein
MKPQSENETMSQGTDSFVQAVQRSQVKQPTQRGYSEHNWSSNYRRLVAPTSEDARVHQAGLWFGRRLQRIRDELSVLPDAALVAREQFIDDGAGVPRGEAEEDVPLRRDDHPEMVVPEVLLRLHEDPGRVGAPVRRLEGVVLHRVNERLRERCEFAVPAALRRAGELQALAAVDALEPVWR